MIKFYIFVLSLFTLCGHALAACPTVTMDEKPIGYIFYNSDYSVLQVCHHDGRWKALGSIGGGPPPTGPTNCDNIGDTCDDGTIYAGLSPDGNVAMYTASADAPSLITWNDGSTNLVNTAMVDCTNDSPGTATSCQTGEANTALLVGLSESGPPAPYAAAEYCDGLSAHGYGDWYLPAQDELNVLYTNKNTGALNGTFNESGSYPAGYYWSSSESTNTNARGQRFSVGSQGYYGKFYGLSVRCVRN